MKTLLNLSFHAVYLLIAVVILTWASLFVTVLNQSSNTNRILREDTSILKSQKQIIDNLAKNSAQRTVQLNKLQNHVDCVVSLFTRPNRANITITDISTCHLETNHQASPPKVSQAPAPTPQSRQTTQTQPSSPASSHSSPSPSPSPSSTKKPGIVKQILNFLGV